MRLLVTGGRDFENKAAMWRVLEMWNNRTPISCLIHGGARGADTLAGEWASKARVATDVYKVDLSRDGPWPAAGPRRNARMMAQSKPDLVLAFPRADGQLGRGTIDTILRARAIGVRVVEPLT